MLRGGEGGELPNARQATVSYLRGEQLKSIGEDFQLIWINRAQLLDLWEDEKTFFVNGSDFHFSECQ